MPNHHLVSPLSQHTRSSKPRWQLMAQIARVAVVVAVVALSRGFMHFVLLALCNCVFH
jgi:hypothetical protein